MNARPETLPGLGRWQATALAVSFVVGCGILFLPTLALETAGAAGSFRAWLLTTALVAPLIAVFARLGRSHFKPDGITAYAIEALGAWSGPAVELTLLIALLLGMPAILLLTARLLGALFGTASAWEPVWAQALLTILCLNNLRPIRKSTRISLLSVCCLLAAIACAIASRPEALWIGAGRVLAPDSLTSGWKPVLSAIDLIFFGYVGWESLSLCTRDLRQRERDIGFVYWASYALVSAAYLALAFAVSGAPLASLHAGRQGILAMVRSPGLATCLTILVVAVAVANINAWILSGIRQLGRLGFLPEAPAPTTVVTYSLLVSAGLLALDLKAISVSGMVVLADQCWIALYGGTLLYYARKARSRMDLAIAGLAAAAFLVLASTLSWTALILAAVFALSGSKTMQVFGRQLPRHLPECRDEL